MIFVDNVMNKSINAIMLSNDKGRIVQSDDYIEWQVYFDPLLFVKK